VHGAEVGECAPICANEIGLELWSDGFGVEGQIEHGPRRGRGARRGGARGVEEPQTFQERGGAEKAMHRRGRGGIVPLGVVHWESELPYAQGREGREDRI
jgi:hypothetical protein